MISLLVFNICQFLPIFTIFLFAFTVLPLHYIVFEGLSIVNCFDNVFQLAPMYLQIND